jgi:hypothetical protein
MSVLVKSSFFEKKMICALSSANSSKFSCCWLLCGFILNELFPKVRKLAELRFLGKNAFFYKWFLDTSFPALHTEQDWFW